MNKLMVILLAVILPACSSTASFVVQRDVPASPSFVVASVTGVDDEFSVSAQRALMANKMSVVALLSSREIVTALSIQEVRRGNTNNTGEQVQTLMYDLSKVTADYLVVTDYNLRTVKFIRTSTGEIVALITVPKPSSGRASYDAMMGLMFEAVREKFAVRQ